jgi:hypothetical protein
VPVLNFGCPKATQTDTARWRMNAANKLRGRNYMRRREFITIVGAAQDWCKASLGLVEILLA